MQELEELEKFVKKLKKFKTQQRNSCRFDNKTWHYLVGYICGLEATLDKIKEIESKCRQ